MKRQDFKRMQEEKRVSVNTCIGGKSSSRKDCKLPADFSEEEKKRKRKREREREKFCSAEKSSGNV